MINVKYSKKGSYKNRDFSKKELPAFAEYSPNLANIKKFSKSYLKYENIIVAARGGSITSFRAYYEALAKYESKKKVYFVDTVDPDYLAYVKTVCPKKKTLLIVISKSGTTVDVIENYFYFEGYKTVFVTTEDNNTMHLIAKKKKIDILPHPEIGGRYSGLTATALFPAVLFGLDVNKLFRGAKRAYKDFDPKRKSNKAKRLAEYINTFDKKGYSEVYMPIYSTQLQGYLELIMQLIHESVGKDEKGITVVPVSAPESQHHSNQRYYGGKKNMQGLFLTVDNFINKDKFSVSQNLGDIKLRTKALKEFKKISLIKAMHSEFIGNWKDTVKKGVPAGVIELKKINEESIGYLTGFFHYLTVYLSWLNNVNPFDQPEVESSKEISFRNRFSK